MKTDFSNNIFHAANDCGYDNCGIIPLDALSSYENFLNDRQLKVPSSGEFYKSISSFLSIKAQYPWARSVIICIYDYSKYRYPSVMQKRYGKAFFLSPEKDCAEECNRAKFEHWLDEQQIRWGGRNKMPLRHAAMAAGLGVVRKNNFFYTEKGSYVCLTGYITDFDGTLIHNSAFTPCSERCTLCMNACKTKAISAPYTLDPLRCVSFLTTFGKGQIPDYLDDSMLEEWICGCDNCQDVCPYNRQVDWNSGDKFSDLEEKAPLLEPKMLLQQSDNFLKEWFIPKTDSHFGSDGCDVLKRNAQRAVKYSKTKYDA